MYKKIVDNKKVRWKCTRCKVVVRDRQQHSNSEGHKY